MNNKYLLVKLDSKGSVIDIYGRGEDLVKRKFIYTKFKPYFYVPDSSGKYTGYDGVALRKIVLDHPKQVQKVRETFPKHYEADIPYTDRFMIDKGLYSGFEIEDGEIYPSEPPDIKPRMMIIDIEVDTLGGIPNVEKAHNPILTITVWDSYTRKIVTLHQFWSGNEDKGERLIYGFDSEKEMLYGFKKLFERINPDILTGWFIIGGEFESVGFDIPYLQKRLENVKIGMMNFNSVQLIDAMYCFKRFIKSGSWKLKDIAQNHGYVLKHGKTFDEVRNNPEELIEYNIQDVDIVRFLEEKYKAIEFHWMLKCIVGVNNLADTLKNSRLIDMLYLREAKNSGIVLPSKRKVEGDISDSFKGGIVFQPVRGVHEWVGCFDISRCYPSIIITLGLSPEGCGILPKIVKTIIDLRNKVDEEASNYAPATEKRKLLELKSNVLKYLATSFYGVLAYPNFRLYNKNVAEKITETARMLLLNITRYAESQGYKVIYGDTDSIMIKLKNNNLELCVDEGSNLQLLLNKFVEDWFRETFGVKDVYVMLKFERIFRRILFTEAKKRYSALVLWEKGKTCNYILNRGFEIVRTDQSEATKELQSRVVEMILNGCSSKELIEFVKNFIKDLKNYPIEKVAISKTINKPLDGYKTIPPHVRGAIYSNTFLGTNFKSGDNVLMLWVKKIEGLPPSNVICFDRESVKKLPKIVVDWDRMIESTVRGKVEEFLKLMNCSWLDLQPSIGLTEYF